LDEPLSNLDARLRVQMQAELKRLHRRLHTTTIHVTHDQDEAMTLGDRIAVIHEGRIQQIGTPEAVYRHPVNRFVAGFLGALSMNFLEGTIEWDDDRLWFDEGTQRLAVPEWASAGLTQRVGRRVVLGVRPEALSLSPMEGLSRNALTAKVEIVESRGERTDVHCATACHSDLTARLGTQVRLEPSATCQLHVDLDRVHFFAADDETAGPPGANLCLAGERGLGPRAE
jgi:multiple sugar transport system ATP-binding protein